MKKKIIFSTKHVRFILIMCVLTLVGAVSNTVSAKKYGKHYLHTISFEGDTFGCVFSPKPKRSPIDGDKEKDSLRWDTCVWKNCEIVHPLSSRMFQDNYVVTNNYITFASIFAMSKSKDPIVRDFDYDLTGCLKLNPEIDYTGYATCSMSGKKKGDYILFYFEHSKLIQVQILKWEEFLDFLKRDKEQGGTMGYSLATNNWDNWGR